MSVRRVARGKRIRGSVGEVGVLGWRDRTRGEGVKVLRRRWSV